MILHYLLLFLQVLSLLLLLSLVGWHSLSLALARGHLHVYYCSLLG